MGDLLQTTTLPGTFPGLAQEVNGASLAYLDNAATTHMPQAVLDAMLEFETTSRANIHRGVHTLSERATDAYERAREDL
jgi:cysteine desulfurase/selenocysteine lyase